jgi:threonine dehydrogenase-like Zn-dependent dehydrogenase
MRAIRYHLSLPRYGLQLLLGRRFPGVYHRAPFACVRADDIPVPALPGPGWVRIRPILAGICGSDMGTVMGKNSPALSPFVSFPAVLGHEVVGRVAEIAAPGTTPAGPPGAATVATPVTASTAPTTAGTGAPGADPARSGFDGGSGTTAKDAAATVDGANGQLRIGDRVVVDPALGCEARGLELCPACQRGEAYLCERNTEGPFAPGLILGFCRDLPGSWAEELVAPAVQTFRVPDEVSDEKAALVEPFAVSLRAVLRGLPKLGGAEHAATAAEHAVTGAAQAVSCAQPAVTGAEHFVAGAGAAAAGSEKILIIGGGTIGLTVLAALRLLELEAKAATRVSADITIVARHDFQQQLAIELGATRVVRGGSDLLRAAEELGGVRVHRPVIGPPVYTGGFDLVYDCIGSHRTIDQALRLTRGGGRIVLVGAAGKLPSIDWTFVWSRELTIIGSAGYGRENRLPPSLAPLAAAALANRRPGQDGDSAPHTFALALELLRRHPNYPLERLITHRFPLSAWREALAINVHHGPHRAVKSVFTFGQADQEPK